MLEDFPDLDQAFEPQFLNASLPFVQAILRLFRAAALLAVDRSDEAQELFAAIDVATLLAELAQQDPMTAYNLHQTWERVGRQLTAHLALEGRTDQAFALLETLYDRTAAPEILGDRLRVDTRLQSLHADPRWPDRLGPDPALRRP